MEFLIETLKNASLHIHAVWLAIAYIVVILAMAVDFIAGLRKAKLAGKVTTSRALKMTTEKSAIKRAQSQTCLSIAEREQIMQSNQVLSPHVVPFLHRRADIGRVARTVLHAAHGRVQHLLRMEVGA